MKFLLLMILVLSTHAFADKAKELDKRCDIPKFRSLKGEEGSCRVIANPKPLNISGKCKGMMTGFFPCEAMFDSAQKTTYVVCGNDFNEPEISSDLSTEFTETLVATLVTTKDKSYVFNDPTVYKKISNIAVEINLNEIEVKGQRVVRPSMFWIHDGGRIEIDDVVCN